MAFTDHRPLHRVALDNERDTVAFAGVSRLNHERLASILDQHNCRTIADWGTDLIQSLLIVWSRN
jgi:hypothetical protein